MAFPSVAARSNNRTAATNTTTHAITLPTHSAGQLLLVWFAVDQVPTVSINTGSSSADWAIVGRTSNGTVVTGALIWKIAASASETLTLTTSSTEQSSHIGFAISPATSGYVLNFTATQPGANGSSTNANPPELAVGTTRDHLWIATHSSDGTVVATAAPASYGNLTVQAAAGNQGASSSVAQRNLNAQTEDPGTFTSASEQWVAYTIAVWEEAAAINVALNQISETDSATSFSKLKSKSFGQATESNTAQTITASISAPIVVAVGQASESDLAQSFTKRKIKATAQTTETDTAQLFSKRKLKSFGQATESDLAQGIAPSGPITAPLGQTTETDTAQSIRSIKRKAFGQASEADTSQTFSKRKLKSTGQPVEVDTALSISRLVPKVVALNQVSESNIALTISPAIPVQVADSGGGGGGWDGIWRVPYFRESQPKTPTRAVSAPAPVRAAVERAIEQSTPKPVPDASAGVIQALSTKATVLETRVSSLQRELQQVKMQRDELRVALADAQVRLQQEMDDAEALIITSLMLGDV